MKYLKLFTLSAILLIVGCSGDSIVGLNGYNKAIEHEPFIITGGSGGEPPVSDVSIEIILPPGVDPDNPVVSVNELVLYIALVTGGAGTLNFSWDFGDGTIINNGTLIAHTYTQAGIYVVTVTVTDIHPITGEILGTASDVLTLTVEGESPSLEDLVAELIEEVSATDVFNFIKPQRKKTMLNKLQALLELINAEEYAEAKDKLINDIRPKLCYTGEKPISTLWYIGGDFCDLLDDVLNALMDHI